ncbi:MAG TPA: DUF4149 domain-containing protein [Ramlibacter sp.]|nr:DUF4149 domain-containing protein [Ramlibacter sp.]
MSAAGVPAGWKGRAAVLAAALWFGSLAAVGFMVVPLLFAHLPSPALAGQVAARLFTAQAWLSLGCGLVLVLAARFAQETPALDWGRGALAFVTGGVLLALLGEFAVAPRIVARQNLALWHTLGSGFFLLQWLCAGVVLWKLTAQPSART